MSDWRLLLTRPADDCTALAQRLAAAGVASSCLPLLAIDAVAVDERQRQLLAGLQGFQAIIVVSKPAARLLLERLAQAGLQPPAQGWFTVGEATAAVLQGAGPGDYLVMPVDGFGLAQLVRPDGSGIYAYNSGGSGTITSRLVLGV